MPPELKRGTKVVAGVLAAFAAVCLLFALANVYSETWSQWSQPRWVSLAMGSVHSGLVLVLAAVMLGNFAALVFVAVWWAMNARNAAFPHRSAAALSVAFLITAASYFPSSQHYAAAAVLMWGPGPKATELQREAALWDSKVLLDAFVRRGAAIEETLLCFAAYNDSPAVISRLIELGMRVNDQHYPSRITALHNAVRGGQYRSAQLLMDSGARTDIPDSKGVTPLALALSNKDERMIGILRHGGKTTR